MMQYNKCKECKYEYDNSMCQFLVNDAYTTIRNIEILVNRSLDYRQHRTVDSRTRVVIDFNCKGFSPK